MQVQEFLRDNSLETLKDEFGILSNIHPSLPLVILNYHQIDSFKFRRHPIVCECRGLILEKNSWDLVARAFPRFFNWAEFQDEPRVFDWNNCHAQSKEDGSLGILYYYNGWRFNTRNSFADAKVQFCDFTWTELFCQAIGKNLQELDEYLNKEYSYIFELVSPMTQVVRIYPEPAVYLLSIFNREEELSLQQVDSVYEELKDNLILRRPDVYYFQNVFDVQKYVEQVAEKDPTFEGVVLRDVENRRWKIKSLPYLSYHQMKGEDNLFNVKHQMKFILKGDDDVSEVISYFPTIKESILENQKVVENAFYELSQIWEENWQVEDRKEFAKTILSSKCKFAGLLFFLRDKYGKNQSKELLREEFCNSERDILKTLFKVKKVA